MKNLLLKSGALSSALFLMCLNTANATTINIVTSATNAQQSIFGVRADTATRGVDLAGMLVTASYTDGSSEFLTWEAYDEWTLGGATGNNFDISFGWEYFELTATKKLSSLLLQAGTSSSIFDMSTAVEGDAGNTPSTYIGFPFEIITGEELLVGTVTATYSGIVNIAGQQAFGDAYTNLYIDFSNVGAEGLLGSIAFSGDLDTLAVAGDLTSLAVITPVPIPATLPMLLSALGGLGLLGARKKKSQPPAG
jgi:hypothetical protein